MKRMKKLFALAVAGVMVLGMSATAMAAETATITVNNATGATLTYVQVIQPDRTKATGWDIVDKYAKCYTDAFGITSGTTGATVADEQKAIAMLIKYKDATAPVPTSVGTVTAATSTQIDVALANVQNTGGLGTMANPQTVSTAGIYAINAVETGYTYKMMAAYVGFGPAQDGTYPALQNATVDAKKASIDIDKTSDDADKVVAVGQDVVYTITTAFPYFDLTKTNNSFKISDQIMGATYTGLTGEGMTATVNIGSTPVTSDVAFVVNSAGNGFTLDLSKYITGNAYAGQTVTITYHATVTAATVQNTPTSHISNTEVSGDPDSLYSGKIKVVKYAADANNDDLSDNTKLAGAGFKVYKTSGDSVSWATFDTNGLFSGWVTTEAAATEVTTGPDGTLTISGLDLGTYNFKEVTAPEGYSINEVDTAVTIALAAGTTVATAVIAQDASVIDTTLSALPATGGMGTTIFTIAGVAIILAGAGLFFARRRVAK